MVGPDADGLEVTRGEVVAEGEPLSEQAKCAFKEPAGPVWSGRPAAYRSQVDFINRLGPNS